MHTAAVLRSMQLCTLMLRNSDARFQDVKAFASREGIQRGVFMASMPNDAVHVEFVNGDLAGEAAGPEEYAALRVLDLSCVNWEGNSAGDQDTARAMVSNHDNIVLVKRKHVARSSGAVSDSQLQVTVRNVESSFSDVKCFATLDDAKRRIFKASVANGTTAELIGKLPEDLEDYAQIRAKDSSGMGLSWVKRKHLEPSQSLGQPMLVGQQQLVALRNADARFADVKCFASLDDVRSGLHMVSVPNGGHMGLVHAEDTDDESYVLLRIVDASLVEWAGTGAGKDMARQRIEQAGGCVWAKRKHTQALTSSAV